MFDTFYPFGRDYKAEGSDWSPDGEEKSPPPTLEELEQFHLVVWAGGGHDESGDHLNAPENGFVEVAFFAYDAHVSSIPLENLLSCFDGSGAGVKTELIALRKLERAVQEAIAKLEAKA